MDGFNSADEEQKRDFFDEAWMNEMTIQPPGAVGQGFQDSSAEGFGGQTQPPAARLNTGSQFRMDPETERVPLNPLGPPQPTLDNRLPNQEQSWFTNYQNDQLSTPEQSKYTVVANSFWQVFWGVVKKNPAFISILVLLAGFLFFAIMGLVLRFI